MFEILNLSSEKGSFLLNRQLLSMGEPACTLSLEKGVPYGTLTVSRSQDAPLAPDVHSLLYCTSRIISIARHRPDPRRAGVLLLWSALSC